MTAKLTDATDWILRHLAKGECQHKFIESFCQTHHQITSLQIRMWLVVLCLTWATHRTQQVTDSDAMMIMAKDLTYRWRFMPSFPNPFPLPPDPTLPLFNCWPLAITAVGAGVGVTTRGMRLRVWCSLGGMISARNKMYLKSSKERIEHGKSWAKKELSKEKWKMLLWMMTVLEGADLL